jgi:hypothetical protein
MKQLIINLLLRLIWNEVEKLINGRNLDLLLSLREQFYKTVDSNSPAHSVLKERYNSKIAHGLKIRNIKDNRFWETGL